LYIRGAGHDSDKIEDTYSVSPFLIFRFKSCTTQVSSPLPNIDFFRSPIGTLAKATIHAKKKTFEWRSSSSVVNLDWEIKQDSPPRRGQLPPKE